MKQNAGVKSSGSRKTYHHGDLRKELLDAARAEIAAHGAQALSMASLARRAGVAHRHPIAILATVKTFLLPLRRKDSSGSPRLFLTQRRTETT